jgi:hypothetical protein
MDQLRSTRDPAPDTRGLVVRGAEAVCAVIVGCYLLLILALFSKPRAFVHLDGDGKDDVRS